MESKDSYPTSFSDLSSDSSDSDDQIVHKVSSSVNENKRFKCDKCSVRFTKQHNLRRHYQTKHIAGSCRPFCCSICSQRFYRKEHVLDHYIKKHTSNSAADYTECPFCNGRFCDKKALKSHLETYHPDSLRTSNDPAPNTPIQIEASRQATTPLLTILLPPVPASTTGPPAAPRDQIRYKCEHCLIYFEDSVLYSLHRGFHSSGSNPFKCNRCGVECFNRYEFFNHTLHE